MDGTKKTIYTDRMEMGIQPGHFLMFVKDDSNVLGLVHKVVSMFEVGVYLVTSNKPSGQPCVYSTKAFTAKYKDGSAFKVSGSLALEMLGQDGGAAGRGAGQLAAMNEKYKKITGREIHTAATADPTGLQVQR